jgi:hypothetical protein
MPASVPQAVQSCHELLLWLIPQLGKLPRVRRSHWGTASKHGLRLGPSLPVCQTAGLVNLPVVQSG